MEIMDHLPVSIFPHLVSWTGSFDSGSCRNSRFLDSNNLQWISMELWSFVTDQLLIVVDALSSNHITTRNPGFERKSKCRSGIHVSSFLFFANPWNRWLFIIRHFDNSFLKLALYGLNFEQCLDFIHCCPSDPDSVGKNSNPPLELWSSRNWNRTRCPFGASVSGLKSFHETGVIGIIPGFCYLMISRNRWNFYGDNSVAHGNVPAKTSSFW